MKFRQYYYCFDFAYAEEMLIDAPTTKTNKKG